MWFTSTESFARVLSNRNRVLLATIAATHPVSLQELAVSTGRKSSNLSRTLKTMERYGFVTLQRGELGRIRPEVSYQSISLELSLKDDKPRRFGPSGLTFARCRRWHKPETLSAMAL